MLAICLDNRAFFSSLYRSLARGARAVFQLYPESVAQRELILKSAMRAGFAGGLVIDYPHSGKKKKEFLVLTCGPPSVSSAVPREKEKMEKVARMMIAVEMKKTRRCIAVKTTLAEETLKEASPSGMIGNITLDDIFSGGSGSYSM